MVEYDKFDGCSLEEGQCSLIVRIYGAYEERPGLEDITELELYLEDVIVITETKEVNTNPDTGSFHVDYETDRDIIYDEEMESIKDIAERREIFKQRPSVAIMVSSSYKKKNCYTKDQWDDLERRTEMSGLEGHGNVSSKSFSDYMEEDVGHDSIAEGLGEDDGE